MKTTPASSRIYTLEERKAILARYEAGNRAIAKRFFGEESLFAPLPEVEPDAAPYPSLGVDDAFRMLKKLFAHQIYSDVRLKILMRYIEAYGDFDADFYRREYMRGESPDASPLEHFVRFGMYRHFKPNPSFEEELAFLAGLPASEGERHSSVYRLAALLDGCGQAVAVCGGARRL